MFERPDNEPPQPQMSGEGVLSDETLDEIANADGKFRISIWFTNRDGKPLRNRDGTRRARLHIEAPWNDADDDDDDDADDNSDDDDDGIPF